ncbi:hypothetical protein [Pandoravirus japonicus]|uniref:Uncharacterized protein n=1 Tax=Pandoravirus japonicus TaxID=2823154 RepID=A0A811BRR6_9VIRU|nr:hypothetical protein [Pandoravirus japonicus]
MEAVCARGRRGQKRPSTTKSSDQASRATGPKSGGKRLVSQRPKKFRVVSFFGQSCWQALAGVLRARVQ